MKNDCLMNTEMKIFNTKWKTLRKWDSRLKRV